MVARVEPPRGRPNRPEPTPDARRYPGLTPAERAVPLDDPSLDVREDEPPPPLWIAPIEVPPASRSVGFVAAYPDSLPDTLPELPPDALAEPLQADPPPPPQEGLFDVPGLLERLWLARALEAHREHPLPAPGARDPPPMASRLPLTSPLFSGSAVPPDARRPSEPAAKVAIAEIPLTGPPPRIPLDEGPTMPPPIAPTLPRSWICPGCYLTNDLAAPKCVGCGRAVPRP